MMLKSLTTTAAVAILALAATQAGAEPMNSGPWRGLYIGLGGHVGEAFGGNKLSFQDLTGLQALSFQSGNNDDNMVVGGLQLGQLWPVGGMVLGIESDISWGKHIDYLGSIRGVAGVPVGPFLLYGTGGFGQEIANLDFTVNSVSGEIDTFTGKESKYGWTAGGGIEALIAERVSLGVEVIHYDFGTDTTAYNTVLGGEPFNVIADRKLNVVRARINYRFSNFF